MPERCVPAIDVVIASRDRPQPLARCLRALAAQTFRDFRVTVVDDGSVTPAEAAVPLEVREALELRFERLERSGGPARARNHGVALATAPFVTFIDDDVVADPGLLAAHVAAREAAEDPEHAVVIGPMLAPPDWQASCWTWWEWKQLEREYRRMEAGVYRPTWRQFHTGNVHFPRAAFEAAGGFDERFTRAEDIELAWRLHEVGCSFVLAPGAKGWHYAERTLASWLAIPRAYARFDVAIDYLHPGIGWLERLHLERSQRRHPLLRLARRVLVEDRLRGPGTRTLIAAATLAYRAGLRDVATHALSVVYDAEYEAALRRALAAPAGSVLDPAYPQPAASSA